MMDEGIMYGLASTTFSTTITQPLWMLETLEDGLLSSAAVCRVNVSDCRQISMVIESSAGQARQASSICFGLDNIIALMSE